MTEFLLICWPSRAAARCASHTVVYNFQMGLCSLPSLHLQRQINAAYLQHTLELYRVFVHTLFSNCPRLPSRDCILFSSIGFSAWVIKAMCLCMLQRRTTVSSLRIIDPLPRVIGMYVIRCPPVPRFPVPACYTPLIVRFPPPARSGFRIPSAAAGSRCPIPFYNVPQNNSGYICCYSS